MDYDDITVTALEVIQPLTNELTQSTSQSYSSSSPKEHKQQSPKRDIVPKQGYRTRYGWFVKQPERFKP